MPAEYPRVIVPNEPKTSSVVAVAPNSTLRLDPNRKVWKAQDSQVCSQRVLAEYHLDGSNSWAVPTGTVDPTTANAYPELNTWRTVAVHHARLTPGCVLSMHCIYCPAGLTQLNAGGIIGWISKGAWAHLRATVTWTNGASSVTTEHTISMEGSLKGDWGGAENTAASSDWSSLKEQTIALMVPTDFDTDPATAVLYSEWTEVEIELEVRGGERIVHAIVHEVPYVHWQDHDDAGLLTVHGAATGNLDKPRMPQTKARDGATFDDNRKGTRRALQAMQRQGERLGPRILQWAANSHATTAWSIGDQSPLGVSGSATALRNAFDTSLSGYNEAHPGWIVAGSMAQLHRLNGELFMRGRAAVVPVRVIVDCERTTTSSLLRLQSSVFEWIDITIPASRDEVVAYGYLASQVYGDQFRGILLPLMTVPNDGTLASIYNISIDFWG
jgi:hypothetical protein